MAYDGSDWPRATLAILADASGRELGHSDAFNGETIWISVDHGGRSTTLKVRRDDGTVIELPMLQAKRVHAGDCVNVRL